MLNNIKIFFLKSVSFLGILIHDTHSLFSLYFLILHYEHGSFVFFSSDVFLKICSLSERVEVGFFSMEMFHACHAQLNWKKTIPRSH